MMHLKTCLMKWVFFIRRLRGSGNRNGSSEFFICRSLQFLMELIWDVKAECVRWIEGGILCRRSRRRSKWRNSTLHSGSISIKIKRIKIVNFQFSIICMYYWLRFSTFFNNIELHFWGSMSCYFVVLCTYELINKISFNFFNVFCGD